MNINMISKILKKIANLSKAQAIIYLLVLVLIYCTGMVLVLYGAIVVGKGTNLNNVYFICGLVVWIPACIMSLLSALSSNYEKEIAEKEESIHNRHQK